jgi:facilitated trehalose transporter
MSLMFFQQWCGVNAIIFYTVSIFQQAGSGIEKNLATVIVGIVQFLATFCESSTDSPARGYS